MSAGHTAEPWLVCDDDNLDIETYTDRRQTRMGRPMPLHIATVFDTRIPPEEAVANCRRIVAAVNATASFTTEGLEAIAAGCYSERLALLASLMMEEIKAKQPRPDTPDPTTFEGVKKLLGYD